jgi:nitrogen fixation NifU-like protein
MPGDAVEGALDDLYRDLIVQHYRAPHNYRTLPSPTVHAEGLNPLCGDEIGLDVRFEAGAVQESAFTGRGCAISQASASLMTDQIAGLDVGDTVRLLTAFEGMLTRGEEPALELGDLEALQGVARFPARIKCALLPWKVLRDALDEYEDTRG